MSDLQKFLDELRAKVPINDVVGDKVKLVRKGREFSGLCPFHNEKTPSFTVNEAKGFYHCFGCGAHGDIIRFEMEANNLPFMEAVQKLANRAGLQVPQFRVENKLEEEKKNSQYDIMEMAAKFFEKNLRLTGGRPALDYLYNRGFNDEIINKFRLGYAPNNNGLKAQLISKGVSEHDMIELGLAGISENSSGRIFDFFRDRVIIPILDKKGRVIAFGGRILGQGQPKYLNSPETPVFNKRRVLYNLSNAREPAYEARSLIICEGYMDVISMDNFGFSNAVAPLGTALTEDQITEAWKICSEPVLCFDGDSAGIRAAVRSVDRALPILKAGYSLKFAFLPDKMDPDDFLKAKGAEEFRKVLNDTKPLSELLWRKNVEDKQISTPEQKALIENNIMEDVKKITDEKVRGYYQQEMRSKIYNELGQGSFANKKAYIQKKPSFNRPKTSLDDLLVNFMAAGMICYPEIISSFEEKLSMFEIPNPRLKSLLDALIEASQSVENIDFAKVCDHLSQKGFEQDLKNLWELKMLRQQNPVVHIISQEIDTKIIEVQLKQIETEIRECNRVIDVSDAFPQEVYERREVLKKERDSLITTKF